jgi:hypothetical protein
MMKEYRSTVAASGVLDEAAWPQLVSREIGADAKDPAQEPESIQGPIVGTIEAFMGDDVLVTYPGLSAGAAIPCRSIVDVTPESIGRQAVLIFERGDARRPILVGVLKDRAAARASAPTVEVIADQERVTVTAKEQIVLRCGHASITLTKAGKLIMQGEYISQRSTGVVRIKGGCVEIN